jgi:hypothetical protein
MVRAVDFDRLRPLGPKPNGDGAQGALLHELPDLLGERVGFAVDEVDRRGQLAVFELHVGGEADGKAPRIMVVEDDRVRAVAIEVPVLGDDLAVTVDRVGRGRDLDRALLAVDACGLRVEGEELSHDVGARLADARRLEV